MNDQNTAHSLPGPVGNRKHGVQCEAPVESAHPLVKFIHLHLILEQMTRAELARLSGLPPGTLKDWWRGRNSPRLQGISWALEALGYEIKPVPLRGKSHKPEGSIR